MMARKRMIDPSIWTDEGMAELTPRQQLLYIGMFSNADDDGRLKGSPSALRLTLPTLYSAVPLDEIGRDVDAVIAAMRQILRYEVDGRIYIAFRNFRQWQRIDKPSASILPEPPEYYDDSPTPPRIVREQSANDPIVVPPSRREVKLREVKLREEKVVEEKDRAPKPSSRDRRRDAVLARTASEVAVLAVLAHVPGFPADIGDETTEKLREYAEDFAGVNLIEVAKSLRDKGSSVRNGWSTYRNWLKSERGRAPTPLVVNGSTIPANSRTARNIRVLQDAEW